MTQFSAVAYYERRGQEPFSADAVLILTGSKNPHICFIYGEVRKASPFEVRGKSEEVIGEVALLAKQI